jgi:hypothetical protein
MSKVLPRTYKICTLDKHLDCSACNIASQVDCSRHNPTQMVYYYKMIALYVFPGILIIVVVSFLLSFWWLLPGYIFYWIFYQIVGELFIRCRHCPFWDESNPRLDCRINCGVPKLNWLKPKSLVRFNPDPLKFWEKFVIQALSFITILIPLAVAIIVIADRIPLYGCDKNVVIMAALIIIQLATGIYFLRYLTRRFCPTCVHFSCPNNRQPYHIIKEYLAKNEIMQNAWEKDLHKYENRK